MEHTVKYKEDCPMIGWMRCLTIPICMHPTHTQFGHPCDIDTCPLRIEPLTIKMGETE